MNNFFTKDHFHDRTACRDLENTLVVARDHELSLNNIYTIVGYDSESKPVYITEEVAYCYIIEDANRERMGLFMRRDSRGELI